MEDRDTFTHRIIGAAMEVHRVTGPELLESVYQSCLVEEFQLQGIGFHSQFRLPLVYKGRTLQDEFILDFYFPEQLIIELKAVERIIPIHEAQLLNYMKLTRTKVGLLINFNVPVLKDGIKRLVL